MSSAILDAGNVRKQFENVIDVLRYHVAAGRFSYVDRIMSAMSPDVVEETVREAVRAALSASSSPRIIEGNPLEYNKEKKSWEPKPEKIRVEYVEDERLRPGDPIPARARLHGRLLQVDSEWRIIYTPPRIPSEDELARFFDAVRRDLRVAKLVASLAMTHSSREGWAA
jgi:CRISPR type I-A-associated protein Csa5